MLNQRYLFFNTNILEIIIYFCSLQIKFITEIDLKLVLFFAFLANVIFNVIFFSAIVSDFSSTGRFIWTLWSGNRFIVGFIWSSMHWFFFANKIFYHDMKLICRSLFNFGPYISSTVKSPITTEVGYIRFYIKTRAAL